MVFLYRLRSSSCGSAILPGPWSIGLVPLNDISQGLDATPIWIPQLSMAIGLTVLALCVVDHSLRLILTGDHRLPASPDAL